MWSVIFTDSYDAQGTRRDIMRATKYLSDIMPATKSQKDTLCRQQSTKRGITQAKKY